MRRPNCLFSSRYVRSALQQPSTNPNRTSIVNFGTLENIKFVRSPKQVNHSNQTHSTRFKRIVSIEQVKAAKQEFLAVVNLLNRSSINSVPNQFIARNLSTSLQLFEKQDDQKESNDKNQAQKSDENKSNADGSKQNGDGDRKKKEKNKIDDKDRENNANKLIAYMTKTILWLALIYSITFTILVVKSILSGGGGRANGRADSEHFTVSWKEFVQHMLAAGEVKEIVIRPQYDYVRVVLHEGAIIKGRHPRFIAYMLNVPSTERFEQRLREVEKSMGIVEGVPVRYERFSELYMKLFAGAVACAVLYAILRRLPSAVSSSRESFVSIHLKNLYSKIPKTTIRQLKCFKICLPN